MSTEPTTTTATAVERVDDAEVEELEVEYQRPMLSIVAVYQEPEPGKPDNLRVELEPGEWSATPGGVIATVEAAIRAFLADGSRGVSNLRFKVAPLGGNDLADLQEFLSKMQGKAAEDAGEDELQAALDRAEQSAAACSEQHEQRLAYLRGLIREARDAAASAGGGGGEDLGDAVQAGQREAV